MLQADEPPQGAPEWIVTFGDMMSLLLCFFVLLYAMAGAKSREQPTPEVEAFMAALREQFGPMMRFPLNTRAVYPPLNAPSPWTGSRQFDEQDDLEEARAEERRRALDRNRVWVTKPGETPIVGAIVNFPKTSSELTPEIQNQLRLAAQELRGKRNLIEIRGHAVALPPTGGATHRDDFDLAYERAYKVAQYLVRHEQIERRRLILVVAGRNEPLRSAGGDPTTRAENSRVEIYLQGRLVEPADAGSVDWKE